MQLNTRKSDAICAHMFDYACFKAYDTSLSKRFETTEKLYTLKTFLKMAGGKTHTPHLTPWIRPWP